MDNKPESADYGKLYLLPTLLGPVEPLEVLPMATKKVLDLADHYIVENEKSARAFIKRVKPSKSQGQLTIFLLNKYTEPTEYENFIKPCLEGKATALLSEAGAPGIADPGADIIDLAHQKQIPVVPITGPSSILLALMASGMNGQAFAFNGYLPIDKQARSQQLKWLEKQSRKTGQTQIFMETPYRNQKLFSEILQSCHENTRLCIAADLTLKTEMIKTAPLAWWKQYTPELEKRPAIFLLDAR
ncbi:MAG: SAM-dependent methyltransferase [Schleiferiaceae bacterium]|nr:SAM-dependent methyltransferase [Schleiferiaceae bacterium]MDR9443311.1 SAM-dependent methyltransferase [Schleiferiaceae bacterium]